MGVWLDIGFPILVISLWVCINFLSKCGCFLEISLTIILLTNWSQVVAVYPFLPKLGTFSHFSEYAMGKSHTLHHHIEPYGNLGLYDLECLDVDPLTIFHHFYLGSVAPIQMVYYWTHNSQFESSFLPCLWRNFNNRAVLSLWKYQNFGNFWMGGLSDILWHRS